MTRTPSSERLKEVQDRSRQLLAALREERRAAMGLRGSGVARSMRVKPIPPSASRFVASPPLPARASASKPATVAIRQGRDLVLDPVSSAATDRKANKSVEPRTQAETPAQVSRPRPADRPAAPSPIQAPPAPVDIETISGLGSALKTKLRRLGLGTAEKLAMQSPDALRAQLGPVARLVNLESLIRSAAAASGALDAAKPRQARNANGRN